MEMGQLLLVDYIMNTDDVYDSVQVDELLFFNEALTEAEIRMLSKYLTHITDVSWSWAL